MRHDAPARSRPRTPSAPGGSVRPRPGAPPPGERRRARARPPAPPPPDGTGHGPYETAYDIAHGYTTERTIVRP